MALIQRDSPLRHLPAQLVDDQKVLFDGLRYSFEIADLSYTRLARRLQTISSREQDSEFPSTDFAAVFCDAWSVVDCIHRMRSLFGRLPPAGGTSPETLFNSTEVFKKARDFAQHLSERLDRLVKLRKPAWGSLSWATIRSTDPFLGTTHHLYSGTITESSHYLPDIAGRQFTGPIDWIYLHVEDLNLCLTEGMKVVQQCADMVENDLRTQLGSMQAAGADVYTRVEIEFFEPDTKEM